MLPLFLTSERAKSVAEGVPTGKWLVVFALVASVCAGAWALAWHSRQQLDAARTVRFVPPNVSLRPLDVVSDRILAEAISRDFFVFANESDKRLGTDRSLQLLESKGIPTAVESVGFRTAIDFLQYLQLNRDLSTEFKSIRTLVALSGEDIPDKALTITDAQGGSSVEHQMSDGSARKRRAPLSMTSLLWYLHHYYIKPIPPLIKTDQLGRASVLAVQAGNRLRTTRAPLGQPQEFSTRLRVNQILLIEALLSDPSLWVAHAGDLSLLIEILQDDFSLSREFELRAREFPKAIRPFKEYWLAVYAFRREDFAESRDAFAALATESPTALARDLARMMAVRSKYWAIRAEAKKRKALPSRGLIEAFSGHCAAEAKLISVGYLRQNVVEYAALAEKDLRDPVLVAVRAPPAKEEGRSAEVR